MKTFFKGSVYMLLSLSLLLGFSSCTDDSLDRIVEDNPELVSEKETLTGSEKRIPNPPTGPCWTVQIAVDYNCGDGFSDWDYITNVVYNQDHCESTRTQMINNILDQYPKACINTAVPTCFRNWECAANS